MDHESEINIYTYIHYILDFSHPPPPPTHTHHSDTSFILSIYYRYRLTIPHLYYPFSLGTRCTI